MSKGTPPSGLGARARVGLIVAGAVGVVAALAGLAGWVGAGGPTAGTAASSGQPPRAHLRGEPAPASRPPRFLAGGSGPIDRPMPAALARDLARFNDDQIRAELESLVLSYPAVQVVAATCPALPCRAEVTSADAGALARFSDAVSRRFKGFLRVEVAPEPGHATMQRARFEIGTSYLGQAR